MANLKTTQLASADTLDGTELVAIVQAGQNVQTTAYALGSIGNNLPVVHIGQYSQATGAYAIAIGYRANAATTGHGNLAIGALATALAGNDVTAIGYSAYATGALSTAVGARAEANTFACTALGTSTGALGVYAVAVGAYATAGRYGRGCIALGAHSFADAEQSMAIGYAASTNISATYSMAIGFRSGTLGPKSIAIGYHAYSYGYASIAIGNRSKSVGNYSVAIGSVADSEGIACTAVGSYAIAGPPGSTAIGSYAAAWGYGATSFGSDSVSYALSAIALGSYAQTRGNLSIAIGFEAEAVYPSSIVLGSGHLDATAGSFVVCGYPSFAALKPVDHYQKFVASTVPPSSAVYAFSGASYDATIFATPGSAGNNYIALVVNPGSANVTLQVNFDGTLLAVTLGTDGSGNLDATQNTLANIAALFPADGFTFAFDGDPASIVAETGGPFGGGADNMPTMAMTADGNAPSINNLPALRSGTLATLNGSVTGCIQNLFTGGGDTATFSLPPVLLYCGSDGIYHFVNSPSFALESSTEGAAGWDAPILGGDGDDTLTLTVSNQTTEVNWMAHLKFEASQ